MKTKQNKGNGSFLIAGIITIIGIFGVLHHLLPDGKMWSAFLVTLGLTSLLISHTKRIKNNE